MYTGVDVCVQECYRNTVISNDWHRKLELPNGDVVVIHSPTVILHVTSQLPAASWTSAHEVCFLHRRNFRGAAGTHTCTF